MLVAGEASGDLLAAELVQVLRQELAEAPPIFTADTQPLYTSLEPRFFGAGGPRMAEAGVELAFDLTEHSVIGLSDVIKSFFQFRRLFHQLFRLAVDREPEAIIFVDFSGFNRRLAHAVHEYVRSRRDWFHDWQPKLIQYVSPQVWASREGRAYQLARDYVLLLSIFPFEKGWYAKRVPDLRVEFVGNPIVDRCRTNSDLNRRPNPPTSDDSSTILLLPGSRAAELRRHLPVMLAALEKIREQIPNLRARMVLPNQALLEQAKTLPLPGSLEVQVGGLHEALSEATVALASTGTVTLECACLGVPTVAIYKTSAITYHLAKQLVTVKYLAMPNLLANEELFPEFIQHAATHDNLARAALELLRDGRRRAHVRARLTEIMANLGPPGASRRAAQAIARLLAPESIPA
ncbi:Lipid-A-disaccharide synthase [Verrucomicrobia bacterium]|nr:Lipid-A-disaccharide synthase [Verrucomicrobiota bacterium]